MSSDVPAAVHTRSIKPATLLVAVLLLLAGAYLVSLAALGGLARWAEISFEAYPYPAGEDGLRVLLQTVYGRDRDATLLLGPSLAEGFLYEQLEDRWHVPVESAPLSNGTIDDYYLFLSYIERVYGRQAVPRRVVLAMEPRVLGSLPRLFGSRRDPKMPAYLGEAINRYSGLYRVESTEIGSELVPKPGTEAAEASLRFMFTKQRPRYRTAALAALEYVLDPDPLKTRALRDVPGFPGDPRRPFAPENLRTTWSLIKTSSPIAALIRWLRLHRSSYTSILLKPTDAKGLEDEISFYVNIGAFHWDPASEPAMVSAQLERLASLVERNGIELIVVHTDEHPESRALQDEALYTAYRTTLERNLPMAKFVDLRGTLPPELFVDNVHPTYAGALQLTEKLAKAIEALEQSPVGRE